MVFDHPVRSVLQIGHLFLAPDIDALSRQFGQYQYPGRSMLQFGHLFPEPDIGGLPIHFGQYHLSVRRMCARLWSRSYCSGALLVEDALASLPVGLCLDLDLTSSAARVSLCL